MLEELCYDKIEIRVIFIVLLFVYFSHEHFGLIAVILCSEL